MAELTEGRIRGIVREEMERAEKDFEGRLMERLQEAVGRIAVEITGETLERMVEERLHDQIKAMRTNLAEAMGNQHVEAMKAAIIQGMLEALAKGKTPEEATAELERQFSEPLPPAGEST